MASRANRTKDRVVIDQRGLYRQLLGDRRFFSLLASKLATRIARDALLYALLVHVVEETGATRHTTFLVLAYTIPAVLVGLAAGAVAETAPLRPLLVASHVSRAAVIGAMIALGGNIWGQYALLVGFTTIGLFAGPAEASVVPRLVQPEGRPAAHSLLTFSAMAGTVVGAVILAPITLAVAGWPAVLVISATLHLGAAVIALGVRAGGVVHETPGVPAGQAAVLLHGWRAIRTRPDALLAFGYLMIAIALLKVVAAIAPYYTTDVLGIAVEKMVYVAAPAVVGAGVSLVMTAVLSSTVGLRRTVDIGFFALLLGLLSVGVLVYASNFVLNHVNLHVGYVEERVGSSPLIVVTMAVAILIGFGGTMLGIAASTTLNQELAADSQARANSTGSTVAAAASLVPLLAVASVADVLGVRAVLLIVTVAALFIALAMRASHRQLSALPLIREVPPPHLE